MEIVRVIVLYSYPQPQCLKAKSIYKRVPDFQIPRSN